ncbi:PhnD/SsuA/transferrin family substrate-binding protein [Kaarinaea lacus]
MNKSFKIRLLAGGMLVCLAMFIDISVADEIRIGVRAYRGTENAIDRWQPTVDYLNQKIPEHHFVLIPYEINSVLNQAVSREAFEFVLTNPASHVEQNIRYRVTPIATLVNKRKGQAYTRFGSVIFTRIDRSDINEIQDLSGKTFMGADEQGFGGWRIAWRELLHNGIDPYRDFKRLSFGGGIQQNVVHAVRNGKVDAGTVRTGLLEHMAENGEIQLKDFKIVGAKQTEDFKFLHSTQLYPEWPFAKLNHTPDELARKVAAALYSIPPDSKAAMAGKYVGWTVPLDYASVDLLLKELRVGPYASSSPMTAKEVMRKYWHYMLGFFTLFIASIVTLTIVARSNQRLTLSRASLESAIAEHKKTDEELRLARRMLQLVLDTIPVRVFWKDKDSVYLGCNKLFASDSGFNTPEEVIGKTDYDMAWKEQAELYRADDQKVIRQGKPKLNYEEPQSTPDGRNIWLETSKIPLTDPDGNIIGILGTYEDITERKKSENELQNYKQHLEEMVTERTAALEASNKELESYSYSIAHDLRSPLRSLVGFSQIIAEDAASRLNTDELDALQRITSAGKHMAELIDDILELSRITRRELKLQTINISYIANEIAHNLTDLNSSRKIQWNIQDNMRDHGDEQLIRLLLQNLIDNAWKFTRDKNVSKIEIGQSLTGNNSVYYVRDNGVGFDMQYADKIFLPFHRLHADDFEGTGIGLATVQRIIQRHGGKIWAETAPGSGTTFYFTLFSNQQSMRLQ